jgi:F420H(2)-dependent quinone reductase
MFAGMDSNSIRRVGRRALMKSISVTHNAAYRMSGGRIGGRIKGLPVLLLVTTGRRSGKARTIPLLYIREGETMVVVGSNGGSDYVPAWWLNLRANPDAEVEIGRQRTQVTARKASPAERARLWPEFTSHFSGYAEYANRTAREIPVVLLEPRGYGVTVAPTVPDRASRRRP